MTLNEVYLPKSSKDAKLVIFMGPPKTGTTSINASIRRQLLCNYPNGMVFWPLNSPLPNPSGKIISCARKSYNFVNASQLNDVARLLCRDALSLKLIPVKLSGISFLTSEYFWSHLDSLQKIITHCRPHFKSIEIVFIKRDLRSLAISGTVQNLKILIPRSSVDYLHAERQAITKRKIVSLLSSNQDISISGLRKTKFEKFQNFCKENASIPINFLDYNKTSDIVSSFFANVFGVKVDKDSFLRKNRSSSF